MRPAGLVAVAFLLSAVPVRAGETPAPLCDEGSFVVEGDALLPHDGFGLPDRVELADGKLSIASGCKPTKARLVATPRGTRIRVSFRSKPARPSPFGSPFSGQQFQNELAAFSWNVLMGLAGYSSARRDCRGTKRAQLEALIDPTCQTMTGELRSGKPRSRRAFVASAAPAVCGTIAGLPCAEEEFCELPEDTCSSADLAGVCVLSEVSCTQDYEPVCGCDGVSYPNDCARRTSRVSRAHDGACDEAP